MSEASAEKVVSYSDGRYAAVASLHILSHLLDYLLGYPLEIIVAQVSFGKSGAGRKRDQDGVALKTIVSGLQILERGEVGHDLGFWELR